MATRKTTHARAATAAAKPKAPAAADAIDETPAPTASTNSQANASTGNAATAGQSEGAGDSGSGEASSASGGAGTAASHNGAADGPEGGNSATLKPDLFDHVLAELGGEIQATEELGAELKDAMKKGAVYFATRLRVLLGGAPPAVAPAGPTTRLRVTGPKKGRWRAGRHFGTEPVEIDATADEAAAIQADPKLSVEPVEPVAPVAPAEPSAAS